MNVLLATLALTLPSSDAGTWPLQPRPEVVRGFELPAKPWLPGHRGVDLAGAPGQPVLAATAGTITYAGALAGRGVVTVATGPRRTTYEPVVPTVTVGTAVTVGSVIGHLSAAGSHCRPRTCLHWGLVQGRQYLNPLTLIPNRPIRLLPLSTASPPPNTQLTAPPPPGAQLTASRPSDVQLIAPPPPHAQLIAPPPEAQLIASPPPGAQLTASPVAGVGPSPPSPRAEAPRSAATERTAAAIVGATAALTMAGGLLIRRH
ncbi:peptidoglycan DD-metalloendopeptidase family protein [Kribbella sp. NPDC055071]